MSDDDQTYYDLLGIEADSSKDAIRDAYRARVEELRGSGEPTDADRAEIARLNSAWSTLSDPFQRQRYDAGLSGTEVLDPDADADEDDGAAAAPAERPKGLLGRLLTPPDTASRAGNGSGDRPARPAATDPGPNWPPGLRPPPTNDRMIAFLIDFLVLGVLFIGTFQLVPVIQSDKSDQLEAKNDQIENVDDDISEADDRIDAAQDDNNTEAEQAAQDDKDELEAQKDDLEEQADDISADLQPYYLLASFTTLVLGMIYTVVPSRKNGQSFGKRRRNVKLVRVDGQRAGTRELMLHYGVPILASLALIQFAGPIGVGIVLVGVLMKNRDKQGIHDRIARTLVVDADSAPSS